MKNFIVYKSSAGSEKDLQFSIKLYFYLLAMVTLKRIISRKILAITFTNKAAKENEGKNFFHYLFNLSKENDVDNILNEIKLKTQLQKI